MAMFSGVMAGPMVMPYLNERHPLNLPAAR